MLANCDHPECPRTQEWDEANPDYPECPEGWGSLTLSDAQGELQSHFLCPDHLPLAWALLTPGPYICIEPGPQVAKFLEAAKASGMRETKCEGCGCFLLTRSDLNRCPPCRGT